MQWSSRIDLWEMFSSQLVSRECCRRSGRVLSAAQFSHTLWPLLCFTDFSAFYTAAVLDVLQICPLENVTSNASEFHFSTSILALVSTSSAPPRMVAGDLDNEKNGAVAVIPSCIVSPSCCGMPWRNFWVLSTWTFLWRKCTIEYFSNSGWFSNLSSSLPVHNFARLVITIRPHLSVTQRRTWPL